MGEKFPVTVAPLKEVHSSFQHIQTWVIGHELKTTYVQTPHVYVVDSTDILPGSPNQGLVPHYIGESKENRWLVGWVCLDVLSEKYPEDEFIQRCLDPKLRFEDSHKLFEWGETTGFPARTKKETFSLRQEIAVFWGLERGGEAILVRILTPAKIKYYRKRVGFLRWYDEGYIVPP